METRAVRRHRIPASSFRTLTEDALKSLKGARLRTVAFEQGAAIDVASLGSPTPYGSPSAM
jgi:hypothetical protein